MDIGPRVLGLTCGPWVDPIQNLRGSLGRSRASRTGHLKLKWSGRMPKSIEWFPIQGDARASGLCVRRGPEFHGACNGCEVSPFRGVEHPAHEARSACTADFCSMCAGGGLHRWIGSLPYTLGSGLVKLASAYNIRH